MRFHQVAPLLLLPVVVLSPVVLSPVVLSPVALSPAALGRIPAAWHGDHAPARAALNDNRRPAGSLRGGVLTLRLDARLADWHPDGDDAPGATVPAFAEAGRAASIPGPLIRVPAGTTVVLTVRNSLARPLLVRGLGDRAPAAGAASSPDPIELAPGATRVVRFRLEAAGTYYYYGATKDSAHASTVDWRTGADAQLTGAIVVDPPGVAPANDRIMVFGIWADTVGRMLIPNKRLLATVNGRTWPNTERLQYTVGDTVRWRMINATADFHPMHLHGFYYLVDSRGDGQNDTTFVAAKRQRVNTAGLLPGATATLTWVPERAGNWLFHCHIPEHFAPRGPLGLLRSGERMGENAGDAHGNATGTAMHHEMNHALEEMNGLVMGVKVNDRAGDAVSADDETPRREMRLLVRPSAGGSAAQPYFAYAMERDGVVPRPDSGLHVGQPIVVQRGEPVSITVVNQLGEPTAVHWHGIELESYFDGVAGFSGAGTRLSPVIAPRDSFVARFTPPRAGTFIYHTHVSEIRQQLAGLAGALIVLDGSRTLDTTTDHVVLITTPPGYDEQRRAVLLNGSAQPPSLELRAGVAHRLRLINITTNRPNIRVELWRGDSLLSWRPLAKDGADLADAARMARPARSPISIGETMDYEIVPAVGESRLEVRAAVGPLLGRMVIRGREGP